MRGSAAAREKAQDLPEGDGAKVTTTTQRVHQRHQQSDEHYIYFYSYLPTRTHPLDRHQAKGGRSIASTFCLQRVSSWGWAAMRRRQALDRMKQHQANRLQEGFSKSDGVGKVLAAIVSSVVASTQRQQQQPQQEVHASARPLHLHLNQTTATRTAPTEVQPQAPHSHSHQRQQQKQQQKASYSHHQYIYF